MDSVSEDRLLIEPFDIDLESLWAEFDDIPSAPPSIGSDNDSHDTILPYNRQAFYAPTIATSTRVECFFEAGTSAGRYSFWTGPDLLCPHTCADDLFLYISTFLLLDDFQWLEFRLSKLHAATGEVLAQYLFFLPRIESLLGNLRRTREQIEDVLSQATFGEHANYRFQLIIRPILESNYYRTEIEKSCLFPCSVRALSMLEPRYIVKNIVENFTI